MPKYGFLVVEGPHDAELAYRLLSPFGFARNRHMAEVSAFLRPLIQREYPPGGDLQKRMGTPLFLTSDTHGLAVCKADGDARLVATVEENLSVLDVTQLTGMGILLDADKDKLQSADARYQAMQVGMTAIGHPLPAVAGSVSTITPRVGAFVVPDNSSSGTLEDLLIECAKGVYPTLLESATKHVATADTDASLIADDLKDFKKPSGRNKALVSSIASILRPGKAVQVSIQDNKWLRGEILNLPRIKAIQDFLKNLFDLARATRVSYKRIFRPRSQTPSPRTNRLQLVRYRIAENRPHGIAQDRRTRPRHSVPRSQLNGLAKRRSAEVRESERCEIPVRLYART